MKYWLILAGFASLAFAQDFDILIVNGRIVDGTGNPSYQADLGIRAGRIAAIGHLSGRTAARTIDARGLTIAPNALADAFFRRSRLHGLARVSEDGSEPCAAILRDACFASSSG